MNLYIEFVFKHWDLFLALIIIIGMMFSSNVMSYVRGYKNIDSFEAVHKMNHEEALMLDVREDKEVQEGIVLGARHIPLANLKARLAELDAYKEKPVIISCRSGHRSAVACAQLRKQGFASVFNLKGGMLAWQSAGMPVHKEGKDKKKRK